MLRVLWCITFICAISVSQSLRPSDCKCRLTSNEKIIGGHTAPRNKYPWHVGLSMTGPIELMDPIECNYKLRHLA
jgi:hypothetical protein